MADDDLTSIEGLRDRHRQVLADKLQVTTYEELASADPQAVFDAMSRIRPRPTLQRIRLWQEQAARRRDEAVANGPAWDRAATFVVSFEQREVEGRPERRLVVEQTELEPEQPSSSWPSWDCGGICEWLRQRVGRDDTEPEVPAEAGAPAGPAGPAEPTGPAEPAVEPPAPAPAAQLRIQRAVVVDPSGRVDAVAEGRAAAPALACAIPCRLEVTVAGASPGREVRVALRLRRPGQPGWSPVEPAAVPREGPLRLELPDVSPGRHGARLVAWAPDGSVLPTAVDLPELTIGAPEGR